MHAVPVIALIDGEHHPSVVRDALERLDLAGVVFCGGEEKLGAGSLEELYGTPVESDVELYHEDDDGFRVGSSLSANEKWSDFVKEKGYAQDTRALLTNNLVLVVPKGNPARVSKLADLNGEAVKHVALAGEAVPAGI